SPKEIIYMGVSKIPQAHISRGGMLPAPVAGEYPPPPLVGKPFAQTAIPYSVLFVVGTLGNTAVLAY
ncbi:hypothetical protein TELCIR_21945, partial [Teladorsagia circumcincta]